MTSLCRMCAYEQADCKGNKDLEKIKCEYFKKPQVFNAKEAAERIAELEKIVKELEKENKELKKEFEYCVQDRDMYKRIAEKEMAYSVERVICYHCGHEWIAVHPSLAEVSELECPYCHEVGAIVATGEDVFN